MPTGRAANAHAVNPGWIAVRTTPLFTSMPCAMGEIRSANADCGS